MPRTLSSTAAHPRRAPRPRGHTGPRPGRHRPAPGRAAGPTNVPLEGTVWQLTNARLSGAYAPIPPEVTATLILQDGNAGGEGGCNQWSAPYTLDGDSLTFGTVDLRR